MPTSRLNSCANTTVAAATEVANGARTEIRQKVRAAQPVVEQVRQAQGHQQLRHGGQEAERSRCCASAFQKNESCSRLM